MKTIYRVFENVDQAEHAMNALTTAGLSSDRIALLSGRPSGPGGPMFPVEVPGIGPVSANRKMRDLLSAASPGDGGMRGALTSLGVPPREVEQCANALRRGGALEAVVVEDAQAAKATAILNNYASNRELVGDRDQAEDIVVPVIREELHVGTREIDAGGVRVTSHVREVPVEQTITIREERVTVERRIIDRPIAETDEAFRDRSLDLRATAEEPIVNKRAHVVEEIRVHKDRDERVEKINDTLRHTEVEISNLPAEERTFDASVYSDHFARFYGGRTDLKTVAPAYEFGERLSRSSRENDWAKVEPQARMTWERTSPGTWTRFKEAIAEGWKTHRRH